MAADRTFLVLFIYQKGIVTSLKFENVVVELVNGMVVQCQRIAYQQVNDERQQTKTNDSKCRPNDCVGTTTRCVFDDPDQDNNGKDCSSKKDGTEIRNDRILPETYK